MRGVPARGGVYPALGIPMLLDPSQGEEHHEHGPLPPFEPGPSPPSSLWGQEVQAREVAFSDCGWFGRENSPSQDP